jgi:hypothetical protein
MTGEHENKHSNLGKGHQAYQKWLCWIRDNSQNNEKNHQENREDEAMIKKFIGKCKKFYGDSHQPHIFADMMILFILLQLGDFATTMTGMLLGASELNPLFKHIVENEPEKAFFVKMAVGLFLPMLMFSLAFYVFIGKGRATQTKRRRFTTMSLFVATSLMMGIVMMNAGQTLIFLIWSWFA